MIFLVSGPSGAGKTYLLKILYSFGFERVIPYTTRQPRRNELAGTDFHFVNKEAFGSLILNQELLDWDFVFGNYYGYGIELEARARSQADIAIPVVARMALRLRARLPRVYLAFVDAHDRVLDRRLAERSTSADDERQRRDARLEERQHARLFDTRLASGEAITEESARRLVRDGRRFVADP